jgi:hypothetical protein
MEYAGRMVKNTAVEPPHMTPCPRSGACMSQNDETTKLTEYVCPNRHNTETVWKPAYRVTA